MLYKKYALLYFVGYHVLSVFLSVCAILSPNLGVTFDYDDYFRLEDFLPYVYLVFGFVVIFVAGYYFDRRKTNEANNFEISPVGIFSFSDRVVAAAFLLQIAIVFFYAVLFLSFWFGGGVLESDGRFLGGKETYLILLIQSFLPVMSWRNRFIRNCSVISCFLIGFLFSWLDASRSGVLPLVGLLLVAIILGRKLLFFIVTSSIFSFYILAVTARVFSNRFSLSFFDFYLDFLFEDFFEIVFSSVSYLTSFSIMHFAYVVDTHSGVFEGYDLIYSLIPLPSMFWPTAFDTDLWRVDQFRPMGAVAEVFRVSVVLAFVFFFLMGLIGRKIDSLERYGVKVLALMFFMLTTVAMYQYSMRTVQWYVYLIASLILAGKVGYFRSPRKMSLRTFSVKVSGNQSSVNRP